MAATRLRFRKTRFAHIQGGIATGTNFPETARRHRPPRRARLRSLRGIPRAPESVGRASLETRTRREAPADAMERHPRQIHVRMSEGEVNRAKAFARSLGMTLSDLIRTLLQLPASSIEEGDGLVVIDRTTAVKLAREMRRWGHHYSQAVHALNAIAYYLRANDMDASDVLEELDRASGKLAAMQPGIEALRREAEAISERAIAGIGR